MSAPTPVITDGGESSWIRRQFPEDYAGYAVEVGAYDGYTGSPTAMLMGRGWRTLAIEPNPDMAGLLEIGRPDYWLGACSDFSGRALLHVNTNNPNAYTSLKPKLDHPEWGAFHGVLWRTVEVEVERLDVLLERFNFPSLDALVIDTEGTEMDVLRGLDLAKWAPKCIVSESWDNDGGEVRRYLEANGYRWDERLALVNDCYLRVT